MKTNNNLNMMATTLMLMTTMAGVFDCFQAIPLSSAFTATTALTGIRTRNLPPPPITTTSTSTSTSKLSAVQMPQSIFNELDDIYTDASKRIKCPFFRRRVADLIDNIAMIMRFLIVRHKSLPLPPQLLQLSDVQVEVEVVPGCKAIGRHVLTNPDGTVCKHKHLPLNEIRNALMVDWAAEQDHHRGYYITGRLNSTIYRDDCFFDGPDPDMPVRGLRKYLAAASHLFDANLSFAKLYRLEKESDEGGKFGHGVLVAHWKLGGVLMLPWRPKVKPWSGWTKYHIDEDGLIAFHEEGWDISVLEAFVGTMLPELGDKIWNREIDTDMEGTEVSTL